MSKMYNNFKKAFGAAILYGLLSLSMAFLNKTVMNLYNFNFPFFIMASQEKHSCLTVHSSVSILPQPLLVIIRVLTVTTRYMLILNFWKMKMFVTIIFLELLSSYKKDIVPKYSLKLAKKFVTPSAGYALHSSLSLFALHGMNIPMYGAVKRCTPLVNLVLSVVILRKQFPSTTMISSILTITVGCFLAAVGDLSFDGFAYVMGASSVLVQGVYLTLVQRCAEDNMSTLTILKLNSCNTIGFFAVMSVIFNEVESVMNCEAIKMASFYVVYLALVTFGSILNYSLFLCTSLTSALTTSLVGVAKSVLQTSIGFFVFGGVLYHPLNITGIVFNIIGGFMYTYAKYSDEINFLRKEKSSLDSLQLDGSSEKVKVCWSKIV